MKKDLVFRCLTELNSFSQQQGDIHVSQKKFNSAATATPFINVTMTYSTDGFYFEADGYGPQFFDACYEAKLKILDQISQYLN